MSCGITEDEIKEQIALKDQIKKLDTSKCKRCDGKPYVILQKKELFCGPCFKEYCGHKFRSNFGKTKIVRPHHKVLIAYSGGQNSTALLKLVIDYLNHKDITSRLQLKPYLLYIDETSLLNCDSKSKDYNGRIDEILSTYQIDKFYSKLEMYFDDKSKCYVATDRNDNSLSATHAKDELINTVNSFKSFTAKEEFIRRIKINLIHRIAKAEKMDFILLGTNATRLSIQLLTDVAQGRGNQVDSEICFIDARNPNIKVLKPMREFLSKEVTFLNRLNKSEFVEIEDLMTKKSAKSSITKITEQFINHLQIDYPATTNTIGKIAYKLQNQNDLKRRCPFCKSPVDEMMENNLSAQVALIITDSFGLKEDSKVKPTFNSDYCYGCNILLRETDKPEDLMNKIQLFS